MEVYFVGIKGVAQAAFAEVLHDAGWLVKGSDVSESFVTDAILTRLGITPESFDASISPETDLVIYTGAHNGSHNPQVMQAKQLGITCIPHAQALGKWFNQKSGIAVCGVGGKSTISAMIAWIFEKNHLAPSYAVGVGDIIGLNRAGKWSENGEWFIAEADEYVVDPSVVKKGEAIPRFSYLKPFITVASSIVFDHPDVYVNEEHTWRTFTTWFKDSGPELHLISLDTNRAQLENRPHPPHTQYVGHQSKSDWVISDCAQLPGITKAVLHHASESYTLQLYIPGIYNLENACLAIAACHQAGIPIAKSIAALATFASTKRRFEHTGSYNGAQLYDDYAHHPKELEAVLKAAQSWTAGTELLVAFQPHTFSRTQALWDDFVSVLATVDHLYLLDIFASARETDPGTISSAQLLMAIRAKNPTIQAELCSSAQTLAEKVQPTLSKNHTLLTLGAGDVYKVHQLLLDQHAQ